MRTVKRLQGQITKMKMKYLISCDIIFVYPEACIFLMNIFAVFLCRSNYNKISKYIC